MCIGQKDKDCPIGITHLLAIKLLYKKFPYRGGGWDREMKNSQ